jgi:hypothetical protein
MSFHCFENTTVLHAIQSQCRDQNVPLSFISVDERYANLKDLAAERRKKLLEALAQFQLNREAYIIDTWITERV